MKQALIYSSSESSWVSCQVITPNLVETYVQAFPDDELRHFSFGELTNDYELYRLVEEISEFRPDKIIILDHKPHPINLIKKIYSVIGNTFDLYVHLFGDFSLYTKEWIELEGLLGLVNIKFITASERQQNFVNQFIKSENSYAAYLPFPVNSQCYYFDQELREKGRERLAPNDEKIYLYTGRLSAQKKINQLVKGFANFLSFTNTNARLYIAGEFDHLGYPFFGAYYPQNFNYYSYQSVVNELPEEQRARICYVGNLTTDDLNLYYNASDFFVSLSLHNDEDYGMSPAEAICTGLPSILSDWGGYASFKKEGIDVELVPVQSKESFYEVSVKQFIKKLLVTTEKNLSLNERFSLASKGSDFFSIKGNTQKLRKIHNDSISIFSGWNNKFNFFSKAFSDNPGNPFAYDEAEMIEKDGQLKRKQKTKQIYRDCYDEYTAKS